MTIHVRRRYHLNDRLPPQTAVKNYTHSYMHSSLYPLTGEDNFHSPGVWVGFMTYSDQKDIVKVILCQF